MTVHEITESWGRLERKAVPTSHPTSTENLKEYLGKDRTSLAFGLGRSYGDSCLNFSGGHINTCGLDRFIAADWDEGVIRCEAGISLAQILQVAIPRGYFLPVTPGTKFVTLGGSIANDIHGKNHHSAGTFGCHVQKFELLRSNGTTLECSRTENQEIFNATIGGLGLTGLITWAEIKMEKGTGFFDVENVKFQNLDEFFKLCEESNDAYPYSVSWVDCLAKGRSLGRGVFGRGYHAKEKPSKACQVPMLPKIHIPIEMPNFLLNKYTIKAFNETYFRSFKDFSRNETHHFNPFFYPLDALGGWNRIYGSRGFYQYQFVVPKSQTKALEDVFETIALSGQGSFLAVLKEFGDIPSPGLLSFPKAGYTLALDFANGGQATLDLMTKLDEIVMKADGRIYPAKDARMSSETFKESFPCYNKMLEFKDPNFSSNFWERVNQ